MEVPAQPPLALPSHERSQGFDFKGLDALQCCSNDSFLINCLLLESRCAIFAQSFNTIPPAQSRNQVQEMSGAASFTTVTKKRDLEKKHLATLAFWDTEGWLGTEFLFPWDHTVSFLAEFPHGRQWEAWQCLGTGCAPCSEGPKPSRAFAVHPNGSSSPLAAGGVCSAAQ